MESKKSIVTAATYTGRTYESPNGTIHYHTVALADGTTGEYGSKEIEQKNFVIGEEVEYTYEPNSNPQYAGKIKKFYMPSGGGFKSNGQAEPGRQASIEKQVALKIASESVDLKEGGTDAVLAVADKYFD